VVIRILLVKWVAVGTLCSGYGASTVRVRTCAPQRVLAARYDLQMPRVYALAVAAEVINLKLIRYRTDEE
jgi:hypothetical protein